MNCYWQINLALLLHIVSYFGEFSNLAQITPVEIILFIRVGL
jgi:hypothetical protein